jgi:uncharacterized protein YjiS (DUF1127 family)
MRFLQCGNIGTAIVQTQQKPHVSVNGRGNGPDAKVRRDQMALMTTTHMPREGGLLSALAALFTTLAEKRARFVEYRRVLAELNSMSDRELADIGISRHSTRDLAEQAAYGA